MYMKYEEFIQRISKYIDVNNYDFRFKKHRYNKDQNEMWIYRKGEGEYKKVLVGYEANGQKYKTLKEMRKNLNVGYNDVRRCYETKKRRIGFLVDEETLSDEDYLKSYLENI